MPDRKRPWQCAETRLGLTIFGRDTLAKQQPEAGLGWALLRLCPPVLEDGEIVVAPSDIPETVEMRGAEYKTLREDCGLSVSEAADFHDVREGTVKKWEKTALPGGAAAEMVALRLKVETAAATALEFYLDTLSKRPEIEGVDLYRYESWSYPDSIPASEGLPHGAHNKLISKTADLLAANGVPVRIEYWSPETVREQSLETDLPDFIARPEGD